MLKFLTKSRDLIAESDALPGRDEAIPVPARHTVLGTPLLPPFPEGIEVVQLGLGCFWGAERLFWQLPGVYTTAVGYAGGYTKNPSYAEVCSGRTGHTEAVLVAYDPKVLPFEELLRTFWEGHDPTQGMRQGNDMGTQYRSALYWTTDAQREIALRSREAYQAALSEKGRGQITTEFAEAGPFYPAEEYHQQYLEKNPGGYCGLGGTGVTCPIGAGVAQRLRLLEQRCTHRGQARESVPDPESCISLGAGEELVRRDAQLSGHRSQRPDRGRAASRLHERDEARRDVDAPRELSQADAELDPAGADARPDALGDPVRVGRALRGCDAALHR